MAPRVEQVQPGLGAGKYVAGLAFAVVLYLSVLLHEASHAVMARRYGFKVHSITLHFLGGMTAIEGESRTPRQEFGIAVVGPLTSLAVGAAAVGLWFVTPDGLLLMAVEGLAAANLLIGVLNLVPGLPLDGGRVLKAFVWRLTGSTHTRHHRRWLGRPDHRHRRTALAGAPGAAVRRPRRRARLRAVRDHRSVPVDRRDRGDGVGASAATPPGARGPRPRPSDARRARRPPSAEAIRRAREAQAGSLVTVTSAGRPVGVVNEQALLATPEDRRPWVSVSTVARSLDDGLTLPVSIAGEELVSAITRTPAHEYLLVEDDGSIYGVLTTADVDRAFRATT